MTIQPPYTRKHGQIITKRNGKSISDFMLLKGWSIYISSRSSKPERISGKHTASFIAKRWIARMDCISRSLWTEYTHTQKGLIKSFGSVTVNTFQQFCIVMKIEESSIPKRLHSVLISRRERSQDLAIWWFMSIWQTYYQLPIIVHSSLWHDTAYSTAVTHAVHEAEFKLTRDISYIASRRAM